IINDTLLLDTTIVRYADTAFESAALYSLGMEQNLKINAGYISRPGLPLDPARDTMLYIFKLDTTAGEADTLHFVYNAFNHFISNNCGFTNFFQLMSVSATGQLI